MRGFSVHAPIADSAWNMVMRLDAPSHIAASTTCPLPEARASMSARQHADDEIKRAAAVIADEIERRDEFAVARAEGVRARR